MPQQYLHYIVLMAEKPTPRFVAVLYASMRLTHHKIMYEHITNVLNLAPDCGFFAAEGRLDLMENNHARSQMTEWQRTRNPHRGKGGRVQKKPTWDQFLSSCLPAGIYASFTWVAPTNRTDVNLHFYVDLYLDAPTPEEERKIQSQFGATECLSFCLECDYLGVYQDFEEEFTQDFLIPK
jgi:hypothetical protein